MTLMGELVVWLVGLFTNGPYGCFGVLGGVVLAVGLMQMPGWNWWRRVGHGMFGVDGGIGRLAASPPGRSRTAPTGFSVFWAVWCWQSV